MNKTTIWEILDQVYEYDHHYRLSVNNKTKDITLDGFGRPAPVIGNLEEIYKNNKSKADKTAKEIIKLTGDFIKEEYERMQKIIKKRKGEE